MKSIEDRKTILSNRLEELENRLHEIDHELESHNSRDWEELAIEREEDEVLEGMGLSGQQEIRSIKAALHRVSEGEYGACVACGEQISEERLDVVPFAPFCRDCAAKKASAST